MYIFEKKENKKNMEGSGLGQKMAGHGVFFRALHLLQNNRITLASPLNLAHVAGEPYPQIGVQCHWILQENQKVFKDHYLNKRLTKSWSMLCKMFRTPTFSHKDVRRERSPN